VNIYKNDVVTILCFDFCSSASTRIIGAKDHASIQINFADVIRLLFVLFQFNRRNNVAVVNGFAILKQVDPQTGRMTGQNKTFAICGYIRMLVSTLFAVLWRAFRCFVALIYYYFEIVSYWFNEIVLRCRANPTTLFFV
jgi:hypothetical protein